MKRKRSTTAVFFWSENRRTESRKKSNNIEQERPFNHERPEIGTILKESPHYNDSIPLPYEMLMKIFNCVIEFSENPLRDLINLARVCESWRQMILQSPFLWSRLDLSNYTITDTNVKNLNKILNFSPSIIKHVKEVAFSGVIQCKNNEVSSFIETVLAAPNLTELSFRDITNSRSSAQGSISRSISRCENLRRLNIVQSKLFFTNQKWLAEHLVKNGKQLEVLNLAMSLTSISSQLFRAICSDYCPNLRVLDVSTCDTLNTRSFDALQLAQNLPNLEILRVGNVSFKRVYSAPELYGLTKLEELSMPIGMRDADRDDALFATLTFGSDRIRTLDLRGSSISAQALIEMPSDFVKELHIDDLCPITRRDYHRIISRWADSLEVLSLVKINCSETVKSCLKALYKSTKVPILRELDLSSSDVTAHDLKEFLSATKSLESINLSSCRSLPRGCKGLYSQKPIDLTTQELSSLRRKLK